MSIDRALHAHEVLKDKVYKEAFAAVEADILSEWQNSYLFARGKRERLWMQLKAIEAVKAKLQSFIDSAKLR
jgi:hypothetical protein